MEKRIFVYGTLMNGFINYKKYLAEYVKNITPAYTEGTLYHLKKYNCPALIHGRDKVYGEVITYYDNEMEAVTNTIDEFEKYFGDSNKIAYRREKIKVVIKNTDIIEEIDAYIFIDRDKLKEEDIIYIENGDWRNVKTI